MPAKPDTIPSEVQCAIQRYARNRCYAVDSENGNSATEDAMAAEIFAGLQFDTLMGCYYFVRAGMFHGVELDGHVHT